MFRNERLLQFFIIIPISVLHERLRDIHIIDDVLLVALLVLLRKVLASPFSNPNRPLESIMKVCDVANEVGCIISVII